MDIADLNLDREMFKRYMSQEEDRSVVCTRPLVGYIPYRFIENSLATATDVVTTVGVIGFVDPTKKIYTFIYIPGVFTLVPNNLGEETINGVKYLTMEFEVGDTVFRQLSVIQDPQINYYYFREFTWLGKAPWYIDHLTLRKTYDRTKYRTGRGVGSVAGVFRVIRSLNERDPDNPDNEYRYSLAIKQGRPPLLVGANNGSLLIDGTLNRAIGGYDFENLISSVLEEDTRVTQEELIIRGKLNE